MSGKRYFYSLGQSARSRGWTKDMGMTYFAIDAGAHYARIAFDAGYRGLSL